MTLLPGAGKLWLTMYMSHAKTCNGFLGHGECVMRQLTRKVSTSTWSLQQATLLAVLHDGMVATLPLRNCLRLVMSSMSNAVS
jgi:hypothetical protein